MSKQKQRYYWDFCYRGEFTKTVIADTYDNAFREVNKYTPTIGVNLHWQLTGEVHHSLLDCTCPACGSGGFDGSCHWCKAGREEYPLEVAIAEKAPNNIVPDTE